eukprot:893465-Amphidinium_carterae.1
MTPFQTFQPACSAVQQARPQCALQPQMHTIPPCVAVPTPCECNEGATLHDLQKVGRPRLWRAVSFLSVWLVAANVASKSVQVQGEETLVLPP